MIDFTNAIEEFNNYKGSEKKKTLIYDNKKYLVKFPDPIREKNKNISYINNAFSEYVGSNVFRMAGFKVQNTILGKYLYNGKEKIKEDILNRENTEFLIVTDKEDLFEQEPPEIREFIIDNLNFKDKICNYSVYSK